MSKIAVIFPSRGLCFSRTADELLTALKGIEHKIYFSHRKPIPECFNEPTMYALDNSSITHLLFIEDDMILPTHIVQEMLDMDKAVVVADYPVTKAGKGAVFTDQTKKTLYAGTGCALIKREVFDELQAPYFTTQYKWNVKNLGKTIKFTAMRTEDKGYGLHDITFYMRLNKIGIPIHVAPTVLGQRKLVALGKAGTNNGAHQIEEWTKVVKNYQLKKIKSWPIEPSGVLITVNTPTGLITVTPAHGRKLIRKGLATAVNKKATVIDYGSL